MVIDGSVACYPNICIAFFFFAPIGILNHASFATFDAVVATIQIIGTAFCDKVLPGTAFTVVSTTRVTPLATIASYVETPLVTTASFVAHWAEKGLNEFQGFGTKDATK